MNLNSFWPFKKYTLITKLTAAEIEQKLSACVAQKRFSKSKLGNQTDKHFIGKFDSDGFKIHRIPGYKDSFYSVIIGKFSRNIAQTEVHLKLRLALPVIIFLSFWILILLPLRVAILIIALYHLDEISTKTAPILIPFIMLFFGVGLAVFSFRAELKSTSRFLSDLFEIDEELQG